MNAPTTSPRRVLALLVAPSVVTFLDRICIAVAGPRMQDELGIGPERWGVVLSAFVLSYALLEIPMGALGDRLGPRRVLTRIVLGWSAFTALTGAALGFRSLVVTRFLFGAGEAGAYPNMAAAVGRHFTAGARARAQGAIWAASRVGGALTPVFVIPLQARLGWRASFWLFGALGLAWVAAWRALYREPAPAPGTPTHDAPWSRLLREPQLWLLCAMYFCYVWGGYFYFSWFPTFLVKGRGFTENQMGVVSGAAYLLGALCNLGGGALADRISRRGADPARGPRLIGSAGLAVSAVCLVATALARGKPATIAFVLLGLGAMDGMLPCAWACALLLGGRHAGAVAGAMNCAGQLGGFLGALAFGAIVQRTGRYDLPVLAMGALAALSAVLFTRLDPARGVYQRRGER